MSSTTIQANITKVRCDNCGAEINRKRYHAESRKNQFCNPKCYGIWITNNRVGKAHHAYNKIELPCTQCGKVVLRNPWQIRTKKRRFCSHPCYLKWQSEATTGERHPSWRGGRLIAKNGYVYISLGGGKERAEHILIAEKVLGRPFKNGECVHHINMNKQDNRKENLIICSNSYHHSIHQKMARLYAIEKFGE